jgi:hypothetical protein
MPSAEKALKDELFVVFIFSSDCTQTIKADRTRREAYLIYIKKNEREGTIEKQTNGFLLKKSNLYA